MRLGIFFIGNPQSGGIYQYSLSILDSLKNRSDKVVVFIPNGADFPREEYGSYFKISNSFQVMCLIKKLGTSIYLKLKPNKTTQETGITEEKTVDGEKSAEVKGVAKLLNWATISILRLVMKLNRINLLIFTTHTDLSFRLGIPYITPIHDLQHRLNSQFPEVSAQGIWEKREYFFTNAISNAEAILVDSEIGKEDVLNFYSTNKEKVKILPFTPPNYLRNYYTSDELAIASRKYRLPLRFLFYPANFWAHKNHETIIRALAYIRKEYNQSINVVFVGSNKGKYSRYEDVKALTRQLEIEDLVQYLGYISNEDIGRLYKLAEALVMPTFFGPTNIPYLEAFALGCPVIGSDIRGIREQIGTAGLLVDPNSPEALAEAIVKIWNDVGLKETLIKRGYDRIKSWNFERFSNTLNIIIDDVGERLASTS